MFLYIMRSRVLSVFDLCESCFVIREFKLHVHGKRQIQVTNFSKKKMSSKKQLKKIPMDKKLRETTNLLEIMNSKRQIKRKLGHKVQILVCRLT